MHGGARIVSFIDDDSRRGPGIVGGFADPGVNGKVIRAEIDCAVSWNIDVLIHPIETKTVPNKPIDDSRPVYSCSIVSASKVGGRRSARFIKRQPQDHVARRWHASVGEAFRGATVAIRGSGVGFQPDIIEVI